MLLLLRSLLDEAGAPPPDPDPEPAQESRRPAAGGIYPGAAISAAQFRKQFGLAAMPAHMRQAAQHQRRKKRLLVLL